MSAEILTRGHPYPRPAPRLAPRLSLRVPAAQDENLWPPTQAAQAA
jgi:hypothetical protein